MNIKEAKEEIIHTVKAYLKKDEYGNYRIPAVRQRPILLIGPPGVGKTQIMEQAAKECGIGLVSYTITHHTRQSAVGLPYIKEEEFEGKSCSVTEYTVSEIIASVLRKQKESGQKEGILFIDEINCVSETLAPTMLQFLQCKRFGNQAVPEGYLIVAAGNPPEYNKSVREFDMVTLDRVRCIQVEADLKVFLAYARERHINGAVLSYLKVRPNNFYRTEADVDGLRFVTARGWEDLSNLMDVYEELSLPINEEIVYEFVRHPDVAEDAAAYFDLCQKYKDDYGIPEILEGRVKSSVYARIYRAAFDERLCVVNLLSDGLAGYFYCVGEEKMLCDRWYLILQEYRANVEKAESPSAYFDTLVRRTEQEMKKQTADLLKPERAVGERFLKALRDSGKKLNAQMSPKESFAAAKDAFDLQCSRLTQAEDQTKAAIEAAFDFMEAAFQNGQEMVVFVTELTLLPEAALFFTEHPCARYQKYNEELLIGTKRAELLQELERDG